MIALHKSQQLTVSRNADPIKHTYDERQSLGEGSFRLGDNEDVKKYIASLKIDGDEEDSDKDDDVKGRHQEYNESEYGHMVLWRRGAFFIISYIICYMMLCRRCIWHTSY